MALTTSRLTPRLIAAAAALALAAPAAAQTEDWQLAAGGFVTASDVTAHNQLGQDRADILAAVSDEAPDYAAALAIYTYGANFPWKGITHSFARFADDYNGAIAGVLPASVGHWGDPAFQLRPVFSALAGTGDFGPDAQAARRGMIAGGTLATIINWTRFEVAMSERKANADTPNWSLKNGSPKNWNEIFAFHHGPEGAHSVHAALAGVEGGPAVNDALYAALAAGQERLVAGRWAPDAAARVRTLIDEGALRLFHAALTAAAEGPAEDRARALAEARGLWLAAAEPLLRETPGAVAPVEAGLAAGAPTDDTVAAAQAVAARLDALTR